MAFGPAASLNRAERRGVARLQALARRPLGISRAALASSGRGVVFVGDKNDAEVVAQITPSLTGGYVDLAGKTTLRELASVLAACDLLVTADTGPMHIAVAVGTPVIALFGATDPARHGPYGARNVVLHDPAPGAMVSGKRPTDEAGAACLARITPGDVLAAVAGKLDVLQVK